MKKGKKTRDAVTILHRRYIGGDADRKLSLEAERVNTDVAQMIHDLREEAGLTQSELAELVGTTQSVISRLESADYDGHSMNMLDRIAKALNRRVSVSLPPRDPKLATARYAFRELVRFLRRERGLTQTQLARKLEVEPDEVAAMERDSAFRPSPLLLSQISEFFDIPVRKLAALAGAIADDAGDALLGKAACFAAQSDSIAKLSPEERRALDEFVRALKSEI
jgi:transcriptional regulator with XRE-family HTH domain